MDEIKAMVKQLLPNQPIRFYAVEETVHLSDDGLKGGNGL